MICSSIALNRVRKEIIMLKSLIRTARKAGRLTVGVLACMGLPFLFLGWPSAALLSILFWLLAQTAGLLRISAIKG